MARNKNGVIVAPGSSRSQIANLGWNKVIYDQIKGIEKGEETTALQKALKLGKRKNMRFRRRLRSFRVRVPRIRFRVKLSPMLWLKRFVNAYVQLMVQVQDQVGAGGGMVLGFQSMYPVRSLGGWV